MITMEQWQELNTYVSKRLETEERFVLSDCVLDEMFGIKHPFWEQMCEYAQKTKPSHTGDKHWLTSDGEPTEIEYARRT